MAAHNTTITVNEANIGQLVDKNVISDNIVTYYSPTHSMVRLIVCMTVYQHKYCVAFLMFRCCNVSMHAFSCSFTTDLVANDCRVFDWLGALNKKR